MTILDAKVLLYAYDEKAPNHIRVRTWLEALAETPEHIGLTWLALWAFLRVSTNPRLVTTPLSLDRAFVKVHEILTLPRLLMVQPGSRHLEILERIAREGQAGGSRMTGAVLAAIATEHGAALASTDRDFARYPGLKWVNPLDA